MSVLILVEEDQSMDRNILNMDYLCTPATALSLNDFPLKKLFVCRMTLLFHQQAG